MSGWARRASRSSGPDHRQQAIGPTGTVGEVLDGLAVDVHDARVAAKRELPRLDRVQDFVRPLTLTLGTAAPVDHALGTAAPADNEREAEQHEPAARGQR